MSPKTLALILFSDDEAKWLVPAAVEFATQFQAHLVALFPSPEVMVYAGAYGAMEAGVEAALNEQRTQERDAVAARFAEATKAQDFASEFRAQEGLIASVESFVLGNVRGADLVVAGRCEEASPGYQGRLLEHVIRHSGRPVLVVPKAWTPGPVGRHVLIGWSDTREAARAAHDAQVVAGSKARIDILHAGASGEEPGTSYRHDMAAAFDRLGHDVTLLEREASSGDAGKMLTTVALERGADMIAVGAFGHSRAYDFVIGAVTHHLLDHADLPVLFSK
jgi:nucleotide-binding universal stress UspA family protein